MFNPKSRGAMFEHLESNLGRPPTGTGMAQPHEMIQSIPQMPQIQPMAAQSLAPQNALPRFARLRRAFNR